MSRAKKPPPALVHLRAGRDPLKPACQGGTNRGDPITSNRHAVDCPSCLSAIATRDRQSIVDAAVQAAAYAATSTDAHYLLAELHLPGERSGPRFLNEPNSPGRVAALRIYVDDAVIDVILRRSASERGTGIQVRCIEGPGGPGLMVEPEACNTIRVLPQRRR